LNSTDPTPDFELTSDYIELNKLLKVLGWVQTGGQAKMIIQDGLVLRNGSPETRVRAKLQRGDEIAWESESVRIV